MPSKEQQLLQKQHHQERTPKSPTNSHGPALKPASIRHQIDSRIASRQHSYTSLSTLTLTSPHGRQTPQDSIESDASESSSFVYSGVETLHNFNTMDANDIIGGSKVVNSKQTGSLKRTASDTHLKRNNLFSHTRNRAQQQQEQQQGSLKQGQKHFIKLDRANDRDTQDLAEYTDENQYDSNHKIFSFSLPFGNTNTLPNAPLTLLKNMIPLGASNPKKEIKEKLKKNGSISSLEELELYQNENGIDNSRSRAIKETFSLDGIKDSIKLMTLDETKAKTEDGYSLARLNSIWTELEGDVVILGGYRGSILRDAKTHKRIWIPIKAGFNMINYDLTIGPNDEDEAHVTDTIVPDGMLTHVGPVDVAKRLIKRLRANPNVNVEEFGYDWRISLDIVAEQLKEKVQKLYDAQPVKKGVYLIAHSMGGLVAHKVLQDYTSLVRGVIYVAAPSECSNILGPIRFGDEVLWNKAMLSKEANFFMRSSFYFLPLDGRCFVDAKSLKRYDLDFFDPKVWIHLGLSPLVSEKRLKLIEARKKNVIVNQTEKSGNLILATINDTTRFVLGNVPIVSKLAYRYSRI